VAAGAVFTFPALIILGSNESLPYWNVTLLSLAGGIIGSLLVVFLRRAYIVDERLPFPEGVACAEVLRAGAAGSPGVYQLALSAECSRRSQSIARRPGYCAGWGLCCPVAEASRVRRFRGYFSRTAERWVYCRHLDRQSGFFGRRDRVDRCGPTDQHVSS
jgi:uncharacterized oligopeptide transporter (OPT) family protein